MRPSASMSAKRDVSMLGEQVAADIGQRHHGGWRVVRAGLRRLFQAISAKALASLAGSATRSLPCQAAIRHSCVLTQ